MPGLDTVLDANRTAIDDFLASAEQVSAVWEVPRAPGKWSPCQITEHVARTLEEGAHLVSGDTSVFPTLPSVVRPLVRGMFFNRVLKKDGFPKAKTLKALDPPDGPSSSEAKARLEDALDSFQEACRAQASRGQPVDHPVFGRVSVEDYAKFMELHTGHHRRQLAPAT
jgi:hypothetical protein